MSEATPGWEAGPTVVVFAKAPVLGTVKTRLAKGLGDVATLALYRELLAATVARLRAGPWRLVLAVTPDASAGEAALWPRDVPRRLQGEGDLGARMARVLASASPGAPVVLVGSDIPGLGPGPVEAAFAALRTKGLVFGPARDGGFYLVGASTPPPANLFANVRWSSPHTLADVVSGLDPAPVFVETRDDLDDAESLARHRAAGRL